MELHKGSKASVWLFSHLKVHAITVVCWMGSLMAPKLIIVQLQIRPGHLNIVSNMC